MIEDRDYWFLVNQGEHHTHYTCIHAKTSCEGVASSTEWRAHGYEGEIGDESIKDLAYRRMLESVVVYYERQK